MNVCQLLSNPLDDSALLALLGASGLKVGKSLGKVFLDSLLDAQRSRPQLEPLWTVMAGMATDAGVKTQTRNAIQAMRRWHAECAASHYPPIPNAIPNRVSMYVCSWKLVCACAVVDEHARIAVLSCFSVAWRLEWLQGHAKSMMLAAALICFRSLLHHVTYMACTASTILLGWGL